MLRAVAGGLAALLIAGCGEPIRQDRCVDLLLELDLGRAAVEVPGIPPGKTTDYVHTQLLTAGGDTRTVVYVHPPASVAFRLTPAPGARLVTAFGLDDGAEESDGARCVVEVAEHGHGARTLLFEGSVPADDVASRRWLEVEVDLSRYAGRDVDLVLRTEPGPRPENDWVGFASPQLLSTGQPGRAVPGRRRTVLLASLDTLRVDVLGAYGDDRAISPRIDAFTRRGELHPDASSPSHWTLPAHASLLTSAYPDVLGVDAEHGIPESAPVLAESFATAGWHTAGFVSDVQWLDRRYGFARGFSTYLATFEPTAVRTRRARAWLDRQRGYDALLFMHAFEPHSDFGAFPYDAAPRSLAAFAPLAGSQPRCDAYRCASAELQRMNTEGRRYGAPAEEAMAQAYAAGVADTDHEVGRLLLELRGSGREQGATIVLVSDHGEEIGDHGRYLHEQIYPELTHTLLAVAGPGIDRGRLSTGLASLVDVAPTILAAVGLVVPPALQGKDLAKERPRSTYTVGEGGEVVVRDAARTVLRHGDGSFSAFQRATDPSERAALPEDGSSPLARELVERAEAHRTLASLQAGGASVAISPEERDRLASLGYVVGAPGGTR